ncbi:MAG: VCBS repeat-containing protein [Oscillospiraceae bacterium]|nr:VCBS repeat-containing protein [Oscillospiraceae bacterium]
MKVLILTIIMFFVSLVCGSSELTNPDSLRAAIIAADESVTAKNAYDLLCGSTVATLEADIIDASETDRLSDFEIIYVDKSVAESGSFDAAALQEYVQKGGSVFLDNETYSLFDYDFIGASKFVPLKSCPDEMEYPPASSDIMYKMQSLIKDFCRLYQNYVNYDELSGMDYGVGIVPSTAECYSVKDGLGIYTMNRYGKGRVFFTNPLLPNVFSVGNLSPDNYGEPMAASTIGANKLLRDYFAELVSLEKYGYAVERVIGNYARPAVSWECHYEDITGIEHGSAEMFEELLRSYGQVPSFSLVRNPYVWFRRAESVTYALCKDGRYAMDPYENAYSSGTHFVTSGKWLSLDYYDNTISYFEDNADYTKRAYPCPIDLDRDGNMDLICGSADGKLYYYKGIGMGENYEFTTAVMFTDSDGNQTFTDGYSAPALIDIDLDGADEIICGSGDGTIRCFKFVGGMVLEDMGIVVKTGLTDAMPATGDLNGDGTVDMAVGSRDGKMRIYYGSTGSHGVKFDDYKTINSGQKWCAPCIADADGNGVNELYAGTFDGYIAQYDENYVMSGYIDGVETNYKGNCHLKFGNNCVPRFYDIDHDGTLDLISGSLEYGMAVPIDSKYFPYTERLQATLDGFKERGIYIGVHELSHEYADLEHDRRELEYGKAAFEKYALRFDGIGVNQHTWHTSKRGYNLNYDNMSGYDGTYRTEYEAGLLWNDGSKSPNSSAVPERSAENTLLIPFYLENGMLMLWPSNLPNGIQEFAQISLKYEVPMLLYEHCDYIYRNVEDAENKVRSVDESVRAEGYIFMQENQLAKATVAAYNTTVKAKWEGNSLKLDANTRNEDIPLYDKNYQNSVGVKVVFPTGVSAETFDVKASVSYVKNNCVYVSLDKPAELSLDEISNGIKLVSLNLPAKIVTNNDSARIDFLDEGMMEVSVAGNAQTASEGWDTISQNGITTFRKYGKADKLKIKMLK